MENGIVNLCDSSSDENEQKMCRLCSVKSDLIDLFAPKNANLSMRILILLATGIEIKENDIVSKMVCHRCCEIAIKLHKYRTNAVANDKLLKEQNGLPYSLPITDQDELLRVASNIVNEQKDTSNVNITNNSRLHCDPLELLNLSFKKEVDNFKVNKSTPVLYKAVTNSAFSLSAYKIIPKVKYKHPSVKKLYNTYKNIILPEEALKSDISPVISLDSAEVSDWYAEQLSALKIKLKGITFKEVPRNSNHTTLSSPAVPPKLPVTTSSKHDAVTSIHGEVTSSERDTVTAPKFSAIVPKHGVIDSSKHITLTSSKNQKLKRNYPQIVDASDNDVDDIDREEYQQFNSDHEQENDTPQTNLITNVSSASEAIVPKNTVNSQILTDQQVATSSTSIKPLKQQSARKRTGRRFTTKRKRASSKEGSTNEREKKHRTDSSESALNIFNEIKLPQEHPPEETEQETVYTPPLESTCNESLPELIKGKTLEIFLCPICNKLYDTKKELTDHERTHLKCKFCKKRLRNLALLDKHQNESCFINIVKNKPFIKLRKIDTIPSVLKQYADAFEQLNEDTETNLLVESNGCENTDYTNNLHPRIEEVVLPMPSKNSFIENEEAVTNKNLITANCGQNSEVVSISDDSADEIECTEISRHKIVNNPFSSKTVASPLKESQSVTMNLTSHNKIPPILDNAKSTSTAPPPNILREKEMIRSLFQRHSYPLEKCENGSQTFSASSYNIKYTNTNLIILDGMFTELSAYKISVHLESQPKISVRFKENLSIPESSNCLECWAFKKPIDIQRQKATFANRASSDTLANNAVILNLMNTPSSTSRMLGTFPNFSESLLLKTPTMLGGFTSNVTMPVTKTTFSSANAVPFTLSSAATNNFYSGGTSTPGILTLDSGASFSNTKQPTNFVQLIEPTNTIQYQAPVVPQSSASLVLEMNQDHDKTHRPENVLHINNNVTNINKIYVLANNVQQIPTRISNVNYGTSYLNNICANLPLPNEQSATIREVDTVNPNSSVVLYNSNNEPVQASNNRLRVKNISELN